jgi:predicted nucleic acid-binding protein
MMDRRKLPPLRHPIYSANSAILDGQLAATARRHGLIMVTGNMADFTGVRSTEEMEPANFT